MGYAITIQRDGEPIPYEEWLAVARADGELTSGGFSEWKTPDGTVRYEDFSWRRPGAPDDEPIAALVYFDGRIGVDHADERWTSKLASLAARLNARAMGDDGEMYDLTGSAVHPPRAAKPSWWKRLLGRI